MPRMKNLTTRILLIAVILVCIWGIPKILPLKEPSPSAILSVRGRGYRVKFEMDEQWREKLAGLEVAFPIELVADQNPKVYRINRPIPLDEGVARFIRNVPCGPRGWRVKSEAFSDVLTTAEGNQLHVRIDDGTARAGQTEVGVVMTLPVSVQDESR